MTWQDERMMSPAQYRWYIKALGMSQAGAGRYLGVSERTSRRFARGEAEVPTSMVLLLRALYHHGEKPAVPKWHKDGN
jgi:DNA-binding transcriptional regulator YiaG